jgi:predicted HicB family RNase H-like nuclease
MSRKIVLDNGLTMVYIRAIMEQPVKRDKRIGIRVSDEEHDRLMMKAKAAYLTLSAWIRQQLLK